MQQLQTQIRDLQNQIHVMSQRQAQPTAKLMKQSQPASQLATQSAATPGMQSGSQPAASPSPFANTMAWKGSGILKSQAERYKTLLNPENDPFYTEAKGKMYENLLQGQYAQMMERARVEQLYGWNTPMYKQKMLEWDKKNFKKADKGQLSVHGSVYGGEMQDDIYSTISGMQGTPELTGRAAHHDKTWRSNFAKQKAGIPVNQWRNY